MKKIIKFVIYSFLTIVAVIGLTTGKALVQENQASKGISAVFTQIYDGNSIKVNTSSTPYGKFDILYVAFAHINKDTKKLDFEDVKVSEDDKMKEKCTRGKDCEKKRLDNILNLVQPLRKDNKIKVVISLGYNGQEPEKQFNDIPLIENNLQTFAPSVKKFLEDNKLDGFDIDYEEPHFSSQSKFKEVAEAIRAALGKDYLFTITPNNTTNLDGETLNTYFDYVNVQSYEAPNNRPCPIEDFTEKTKNPEMKGLIKSKVLAGADIANEKPEDINNAINKYKDNKLAGVFAWQITPTSNFNPIAEAMWNATRVVDVEAGPIWDDNDAKEKCPQVCASQAREWNGQWTTTVPKQMSVCGCNQLN